MREQRLGWMTRGQLIAAKVMLASAYVVAFVTGCAQWLPGLFISLAMIAAAALMHWRAMSYHPEM